LQAGPSDNRKAAPAAHAGARGAGMKELLKEWKAEIIMVAVIFAILTVGPLLALYLLRALP